MELSGRASSVPPGEVERAQLVYARWLSIGTALGLAMLAAGFMVYVTGLSPPHVPLAQLPRLWGLPLEQFLSAARAPAGWGWLELSGHGDYLNFFGIALLGSISVLCYLRVVPLLATRERAYALIAVLEIAVLIAAASGLVAGGH